MTIVIDIPAMTEAAATALKNAIAALPTLPAGATIRVAYTSAP